MTREVITLDGPAATGKSTVAHRVAERLELPFVSSGLLYRAATWLVRRRGVDAADEAAVLALLAAHEVQLLADADGNRLLVDGVDVSAELHTDEVDAAVSAVASLPQVRAWVMARLRDIPGPFVIEGRDMGTAVFPDARHKFYLTAPAEERARRRVGERAGDLAAITAAIRRRDRLDARQLAPAPDALRIDTGDLTLEQVVARVLAQLEAAGVRR